MRRKKALKRGRGIPILLPILLAGSIGYLLGSAHITAFRSADLSAAEAVALRFPQDWKNASIATAAAIRTATMRLRAPKSADVASADVTSANVTSATAVMRDARLALMSPEPMVPQTSSQATPQAGQDVTSQAPIQTASAEQTDASLPPSNSAAPQADAWQAPAQISAQSPAQKPVPVASRPAPATKVAAIPPHRPINDRPGYMLNDTQIASIKERLHLTPDQEQMWPAVEAALRNIAYTRAQQAQALQGPHGRSAPTNDTQTAAVDPNAVQGLKSAAVPLIMSFNAEQKEEVRNLAHVMGLDQLASQF